MTYRVSWFMFIPINDLMGMCNYAFCKVKLGKSHKKDEKIRSIFHKIWAIYDLIILRERIAILWKQITILWKQMTI